MPHLDINDLHKERDKNGLMNDLKKEHAGILRLLLHYYIRIKNDFNNSKH